MRSKTPLTDDSHRKLLRLSESACGGRVQQITGTRSTNAERRLAFIGYNDLRPVPSWRRRHEDDRVSFRPTLRRIPDHQC
jgi:hypothetical protein